MTASAQIAYPSESACEESGGLGNDTVPDERIDIDAQPDVDRTESVYESCDSAKELGRKGEEAAARYLEARDYEIVERNWKCRFGEADIIARDVDGSLCFVEVKTRRSIEAGLPEEAITHEKQARYERIALCYMMEHDDWEDNDPVRFDAIGICVVAPHRALLRHHRGCFNGCF